MGTKAESNTSPLHPTASLILVAIDQYTCKHGYAPTIRDIVTLVGLSSTSVVSYHLRRLEKRGYLTRERYHARTIQLLDV